LILFNEFLSVLIRVEFVDKVMLFTTLEVIDSLLKMSYQVKLLKY